MFHFFETIAGEMNGINTSENTTLNYQVGDTLLFAAEARAPWYLPEGVSIAEAASSSAPIQCRDNSPSGLDSANATEYAVTWICVSEQKVRIGFQKRIPRTLDEFTAKWKQSSARDGLLKEI
ncbi:hypothetical protein ETB97_007260 [Aspergillus alliaceus]|uniref:Uncharacterized protein n=1 Tax=Petromyces alliaceus TaxID=209559 RepID=A0A8H5ZY93_PETAA|nr:hypothetical protein ETB97_007260 [Aspergillus burnettii]